MKKESWMKFFWSGAGHVRYLLDVRSLQKEHLNRREDYFLIHIQIFRHNDEYINAIDISITNPN